MFWDFSFLSDEKISSFFLYRDVVHIAQACDAHASWCKKKIKYDLTYYNSHNGIIVLIAPFKYLAFVALANFSPCEINFKQFVSFHY